PEGYGRTGRPLPTPGCHPRGRLRPSQVRCALSAVIASELGEVDSAQRSRKRHRAHKTAQNRQRVAPPGSTVPSAVATRGARRYTYHGGGPADGALNSAVRASPVSPTRAGKPSAAHRAAMSATVGRSVTLWASPSTTRSKSWTAMLKVHRGSRARFLAFRVRSPVSNQNAASTHSAPTPVTCGLP